MKYEKTDNPNIVKGVNVVEHNVNLDELNKQVVELQKRLVQYSKLMKKEPDQETLDFWNELNAMDIVNMDIVSIEAELKQKQELLALLKKL